ncbi:MAG TPA: chaperone modulator CbpM [Casimicrobiaceae bacterium]|nr:chaperone modulator CbpM [Casimicrobiaceae bacterium]
MNIELTEATWMEDAGEISLARLAELSGLEEARLRELVDYGALAPVDPAAASWTFSAECVVTARTACRLLNDFELEPHGLALVLTLLERIRELRSELQRLHAEMPR